MCAGITQCLLASVGPKRKLLVLDLNKVLWSTIRYARADKPVKPVNTLEQGKTKVHIKSTYGHLYMYTERPGLHEFLEKAFAHFDVGIWTCAAKPRAMDMMNLIFDEKTRSRFKFVYTQEFTVDSKIPRPDVKDQKANILFKDLQKVWDNFGDLYDATNTILLDDSPEKSWLNPCHSGLTVDAFEAANQNTDVFLLEVLWPYLSRVLQACDSHQFMVENEPKWHILNCAIFEKENDPLTCQLNVHWSSHKHQPITRFTILDFTSEEIAWETKADVQASQGIEHMSDPDIRQKADAWLTDEYVSGPCRDNPRLFVKEVLKMRDSSLKFVNYDPEDACTRDRHYDFYGLHFTCTNELCKYGYNHENFPRFEM